MIIALAQLNFRVGDFDANTALTLDCLERAQKQGADLVVFSELSVCGYPPADLLQFDGFVEACLQQVNRIASRCHGIAAVVGSPAFNPHESGKRLSNAAFLLSDGQVAARCDKGLLPTYDVFDEYRYFEPARTFRTVPFRGKRIALTVCEDLWDVGPRRMYSVSPLEELMRERPDLVINISASPFAWNRCGERLETFALNARRARLPVFMVNQVGAHAELVFDGASAAFTPSGRLAGRLASFREDLQLFDLEALRADEGAGGEPPVQGYDVPPGPDEKNENLMRALVFGLSDYCRKTGIREVLLGLSGGLDSALTLVLAVHALGKDKVWAVLMPGPHSSDHSVSDAVALAKNLGVRHDILPIHQVVASLQGSLDPLLGGLPPDVTEENLQARARAVLLMGLSNKFGHMLLNTSNKSEAAVGYGTLYGDMCGGLSVIGDLYKTEVYGLARYINRREEVIPWHTIEKPPSAELRPGQKDSDSLPEYGELDPVLFQYIEREKGPREIVDMGFPQQLVRQVLRLVNACEYKRKQTPPVLRVSQKGFGSGRRMPIVARYPG
jgi:NAD+ synthase (glutamine-hydrolysing)